MAATCSVFLNVQDIERAMRFYERMGATRAKEWWPYFVQGEGLDQLAEKSDRPAK